MFAKSSQVREALQDFGYELHYLDAPIAIKLCDFPSDDSGFPHISNKPKIDGEISYIRSWWPYDFSKKEYSSLEQGLHHVSDAIDKYGPFEGIIGFSQGAAFAGLLCEYMFHIQKKSPFYFQGEKIIIKQKMFKFAIFFSGFRIFIKSNHLQFMYKKQIDLPTLHVIGDLDLEMSRRCSLSLWRVCKESKRTIIRHRGAHFIPNGKNQVNQIIKWVKNIESNDIETKTLHSSSSEDLTKSFPKIDSDTETNDSTSGMDYNSNSDTDTDVELDIDIADYKRYLE